MNRVVIESKKIYFNGRVNPFIFLAIPLNRVVIERNNVAGKLVGAVTLAIPLNRVVIESRQVESAERLVFILLAIPLNRVVIERKRRKIYKSGREKITRNPLESGRD